MIPEDGRIPVQEAAQRLADEMFLGGPAGQFDQVGRLASNLAPIDRQWWCLAVDHQGLRRHMRLSQNNFSSTPWLRISSAAKIRSKAMI